MCAYNLSVCVLRSFPASSPSSFFDHRKLYTGASVVKMKSRPVHRQKAKRVAEGSGRRGCMGIKRSCLRLPYVGGIEEKKSTGI